MSFQTTNSHLSEMMADFALSLRLEEVPAEVISHGKMLLLDTFGVSVAAINLEHAKIIRDMVLSLRSNPQATLWGSGDHVQLSDAVLHNAALIHGMDYDDTHVRGIVHPSAAVVSTAVTVGEVMQSNGTAVLEAIIAGWEIIVRLALAGKGRFHDVGYHGTGIVSSFAAACVAAKLMGLPKPVLVNALGICGSQSAALQEFLHDGSWVKKIHPGWAAHSAVYALMMAQRGFVGPLKVLEGEFGLWKTHLGGQDGLFEEFENLGSVWHTPEITFKMYPVCHFTHSFISCVSALMKQHALTADDIEKIVCRIDSRGSKIVCEPREAKIRPDTDYMMRFSLPYVTAITALKGHVSPWEIDIRYAMDPKVQALMDKVECIVDESVANPGHFPGWVAITTKGGETFTLSQPFELGSPQNPIRMENVMEKFRDNVGQILSENAASVVLDKVQHFEKLAGMPELISCLKIIR